MNLQIAPRPRPRAARGNQALPLGLTRPVLAIYQGTPACGPTFHARTDMEVLRAAGLKVACLSRDDIRHTLTSLPDPADRPADAQITTQHIGQLRVLLTSGAAVLFVPDPDRSPDLISAWAQLAAETGAQLHVSPCHHCPPQTTEIGAVLRPQRLGQE